MIYLTLIFYFLWLIFLIENIDSDFYNSWHIICCGIFFVMFLIMFAITIESVENKKATQHTNYTECIKANSINAVDYGYADERIKNIQKLCNAIYNN